MGRYGSVGIELVLTILILSWVGHWLDDRYWGSRGWGLAGGFVLGVAVGFRNLVRTAQQMQRDIERAEARDPEAGRWHVDPGWVHDEPAKPRQGELERKEPSDAAAPETHHDGASSTNRPPR